MNKKYTLKFSLFLVLLLSCQNQTISSTSNNSTSISSSLNSSLTDVSISEISFRLRGDNVVNYANHALWIWEDGFDGELFIFSQSYAYGGYITLPIDT